MDEFHMQKSPFSVSFIRINCSFQLKALDVFTHADFTKMQIIWQKPSLNCHEDADTENT